jgi:S-adenosylmethionine:tRNA ribosyltransferase-isomerase
VKTSDYFFDLPEGSIAKYPSQKRDESRLLVLDRASGEGLDKKFFDVLDYFNRGDLLVLNETKVIPARLFGRRKTGGKVEIMLLKNLGGSVWSVLARPAKRLRADEEIIFDDDFRARVLPPNLSDVDAGTRRVELIFSGDVGEKIRSFGKIPLPPYIRREAEESDKTDYQTVYAKREGSVASPTAGLHWTEELLSEAKERGIGIAKLTLDIGLGTFAPVKAEKITEHKMHSESFEIPPETASAINETRLRGGRVVACGTTVCRALEASAGEAGRGETNIFIYPSYQFKIVDALLTNFHLPGSTLLMLVSAFAGRERILAAYAEAARKGYRFFSYGDAMLIV